MALDKLVDGTQLDSDLSDIADAIRAKGGTSAQLAFPTGFVSAVQAIPTGITPTGTISITSNGTYDVTDKATAVVNVSGGVTPTGTKQIGITQNGTTTEDVTNYASAEITVNVPTGGGSYDVARTIANRTITEYIDPDLTELGHSAFRNCRSLSRLIVHGVKKVNGGCIENTAITALALPALNTIPGTAYGTCSSLLYLDYGEQAPSVGTASLPFSNLQVLILRRSTSRVGVTSSSLNQTPMKNGGAGCTVYIPKALYDHLGDGTNLDYKADSTWATYDGYGTITWAQIEGSIYETQYADGTPIPTA